MQYCLDSNVFIQAKNAHYHFDICPGFWDLLDSKVGIVGSINPVFDELKAGNDELKNWAVNRKDSGFFVDATDPAIQKMIGSISNYVVNNFLIITLSVDSLPYHS